MKKTKYLEIIGILSLSLMITSIYAVSSCIPEMKQTFREYDAAAVEFLISAPAAAMVVMIGLTPVLSRYIPERTMIVISLLIFGICGVVPVFAESYVVICAARIFMGVGIGMLNAKAVSLIGQRFEGTLRAKLQGIRCSMETIGQSVLMLAAGQLLRFGWNYAFAIYGVAFIVLLLYLAFVPEQETPASDGKIRDKADAKQKMSRKEFGITLESFLLGVVFVSASVMISLRTTTLIVETGIGTDVEGATVLSVASFAGLLAGLVFGKVFEQLGKWLLPAAFLVISGGMLMLGWANHLLLVAAGSCICNFAITLGTSYMFNGLSENISPESLTAANAAALVGCNLGSCLVTLILKGISFLSPSLSASFFAYAMVFLALAGGYLLRNRSN